jgi:hypothetical protein
MKSSATQHRPGRGGATPIMRRKRLSTCAECCDTPLLLRSWARSVRQAGQLRGGDPADPFVGGVQRLIRA